MSIECTKTEDRTFLTLHTEKTTYQMMVDPHGALLHLYYGKRAMGTMEYLLIWRDRGFSGNPWDAGKDRTFSLDSLPQEYPTSGTGDFRATALTVEEDNGFEGCDLRYVSHEISDGKYGLPGLPAMHASESESQTLTVHLKDHVSGLEVDLLYGVLPELDIITRAAIIRNTGDHTLTLTKVLSADLDFLTGDYDVLTFCGRYGMERNLQRTPVDHGEFRILSRRGASSHQYNPLVILADHNTTEDTGECYAMEFVYSGSFQASVEKDQFDQVRLQMGLAESKFRYPLGPGETFAVPETILSFSGDGLEVLSQNLMDCVRLHICRRSSSLAHPVLLNSWEGCYFDFDGNTIRDMARQAKDLGVDLLVMDDGWFGNRNDDTTGLGDWQVNEEKLRGSLPALIADVHDLGLKFGIWFEPEMVSEDSDLFRAHPDWALASEDRRPIRSRYQLVLDFSRPDVVDQIFSDVCKVLDMGIDYIKWDFNRSIADVWSHAAQHQGTVLYNYILGLYSFLERLRERYPDLLIEGCSGGGGRFDAGMLYYTPQIWGSDNTDAVDRLKIQYGTSFGYPISVVGAHVSAVPNEQNGRITSLDVRGTVAMSGSFGFELDPATLSDEDRQTIQEQIAFFREFEPLIREGRYYRLSDPAKDPATAWLFVSRNRSIALLNIVTTETFCNMPNQYIRVRGLEPGAFYRSERNGHVYPADGLRNVGYPVPYEPGEYRAYQIVLRKVED